eukprot:COSAG03_NODE_15468_length_430_cov_0.779456_1_plen_58_part_10
MEIEAGGPRDEPQQSLLRFRVRHNHRRKPNDPQRADSGQQLKTGAHTAALDMASGSML